MSADDHPDHDPSAEGEPDVHPDHDVEQRRLHEARRSLTAMQQRAAAVLRDAEATVAAENSVDSRVVASKVVERARALDVGDTSLCFGRIDHDPTIGDEERWYVGRRHIEDADGTPLIVDWRAPVAIPYYRATAADPMMLALRRRFSTDVDTLLAIFDEHLDDPDSTTAVGIADPVLAEVEADRSGQMRDIVATIAGEQDEIIRAPLDQAVIVQGGPGTGKTAVGLHRAAFLLFEHRLDLVEHRILVLGPSRVFLRYISAVLPSLGETAVVEATLESLFEANFRVRDVDSPEVARVKGERAMAEVLRRAIRQMASLPTEPVTIPIGSRILTYEPEALAAQVAEIWDRDVTVSTGRTALSAALVRDGWRQALQRGADPTEEPTVTAALRRSPDLTALLDALWPTVGAAALVRRVLGNRRARRAAGEGLIDPDRLDLIHRKPAGKVAEEPWTTADLPLLDEATALTVGVRRTYGHVVVDEAQDLSAMALRTVGRRARDGSMTVLGDLAQATAPGAASRWETVTDVLAEVVPGDELRPELRALTVGYRVPGPILSFANRLLPVVAPDVPPPVSIRARGLAAVDRLVADDVIVDTVVAELGRLTEIRATIGVVATDAVLDAVAPLLQAAGHAVSDTRRRVGLDEAIALVSPTTAKGLEFDATIVVEPAAFSSLVADDRAAGLRLLYVALTRSVQELVIVRSDDLPPELASD